MHPDVVVYLSTVSKWRKETEQLRGIILACGLKEEWKWRQPCYTFQNRNVVIIGTLKECCVLGFFKGVLLKDTHNILMQTRHMQAVRQVRFSDVQAIIKQTDILKAYIYEAIEVERAGLKISYKQTADFVVVKEFQNKLAEMPVLKAAFTALTPGRQRAYLLYFSAPKQSQTRITRIEKCLPQILNGRGLKD